ncbi:MAG TPA: AAA family ATPase [Trebonia sp.]|jgi:exonuclease SbcC|nr:AAA family ATPase [Trebonia sp.]
MRPHRLRVTAFGAFAGPQEVRFDDLDGLFLLHGETGAGKTTLLDAIAFALYGQVPGVRGDARRLRSDHAAPDVLTEVQLEATIGGRLLRITRRPEQARPKKAGAGFTREPASILLEEETPAGGWEGRSPRVGEADKEIIDLMGMSAAQFFQVVLLPQGQFAKFLHSDAKERAALLQRLFGTDRFQAVERWLADRRVVTQRDVEAASDVVDRLLNRVAQEARAAVPDDAAVPADGAPWQVAWASELLRAARAKREAAATLAAARGQELDAAQAALSAAVQLADRQRRRADALSRQAALQAATSSIEALRGEYAAANRAAQVAAVLDVATEAARTAARARTAAERAQAAVPAEAAPGDATAAALRGSARDQEARLVRLDTLRSVARQAELEDTAASAARERAASLAETLAATTSASGRTRASRPGKLQARDAASQAAADLPAAKTAADSRRGVAKNLAALVRERSARERLAEAHRLAAAGALARQKESDRIHQVRIDGMSGELAKNLFDGFPCPVCGSLDHPDPSEMPASWVSPDEERDAAAAARTAAAAAETASREVSAADAVIQDLQARLAEAGTDAPADLIALATIAAAAEADAARLEADASRLAKTAGRLGALQRELDDLDAAVAAADTRQAELTEQRTAALDEAQGAAQRAAGHRQALHAQLGDAGDLDAALASAHQLADVLTAAADALDEASRAAGAADEAAGRAIQAAAGAGFGEGARGDALAGANAARAAMRPADWRESADDRIREHEASAESVAGLLADPDLAVEADPAAPVAAAREAVAAARREHEESVGAHDVAKTTVEQLDKLAPQLTGAVAAVEPLVARAAETRHLADLVNANGTTNQYKMTLSSFVLAARLEEVAAAASQRLVRMTAGRYSLAHTDSGKGAKKAGLGLLACDSWTGQDRDTSTLSGGETFLASLALALGLADVVTAEAAGTPMEALFVDEGFGTLDEDTLDEVMTVLDGLREGGRMVGIVSHVSELRQRIPARIHVRKGHHGSSVSVTAG